MEADLTDEASINKAITGSTFVVHTASPVPEAGKLFKTDEEGK